MGALILFYAMGIAILLFLFFFGAYLFLSIRRASYDGQWAAIYPGFFLLGVSTISALVVSYYIGWWFLFSFLLIEVSLIINETYFYIQKREKYSHRYFKIILVIYSILFSATILGAVDFDWFIISILVVMLFWLALIFIPENRFSKFILFVCCPIPGTSASNYESDLWNLSYSELKRERAKRAKFAFFEKGDYSLEALKRDLECFVESYNNLGKKDGQVLLERLCDKELVLCMKIINNENDYLRVWVEISESSPRVNMFLLSFLDNSITKLESESSESIRTLTKGPSSTPFNLEEFVTSEPLLEYQSQVREKLSRINMLLKES